MIRTLPLACLIGFGTVSPHVDPMVLVPSVYRSLWDQVGGSRVVPQTIERMVASKNPFELPEQDGPDVTSLRLRLNDLQKMVETKSWDTEEVRAQLIADLKERLKGGSEATAKRDVAVVRSQGSKTVNMAAEIYLFPPNQQRVLGLAQGHRNNNQYSADLSANQVVTGPGYPVHLTGGQFSNDGHEVFFGSDREQLLRVPFKDGLLDFSHATKIGDPLEHGNKPDIIRQTPGNLVFTSDHYSKYPTSAFNLTTGKRTTLDRPEFDQTSSPDNWGVIPGTEQIYYLFVRKNYARLRFVTIDENGKQQTVGRDKVLKVKVPRYSDLTWLDGGKRVLASSNGRIDFIEDLGQQSVNLVKEGMKPLPLTVRADEKVVAVLISPALERREKRTEETAKFIRLISLETKKTIADVKLPVEYYAREIDFLPDGKIFVRSFEKQHLIVDPSDPEIQK